MVSEPTTQPAPSVESSPPSEADVLLRMDDISKLYPGVQALDHAELTVRASEIHGLVGKNGAGKSTLMGVLMGLTPPDSGYIEINGHRYEHFSPQDMLDAGIAYVPQHVKMLNTLSVAENILAGDLPRNRLGLIDWKEAYEDSERRLRQLGLNIDVRRTVEALSVAEQTMLAIAKALFSDACLIILDEPTASLPRKDIDLLFSFVRSLKEQGVAFVYISHHLEEIFEICDEVTVMRDGHVVGSCPVADITTPELIHMMVGEVVKDYERESTVEDHEVFRVEGLTRRGAYEDIDFTLRRGEVVGLSGLQGSGVGKLAMALFGMQRTGLGEVYLNGEPLDVDSPKEAFDEGVAYLPQDRHRYGLISLRPIRENVTYSILDEITSKLLGIVPRQKERSITNEYIDKLGIVTPSLNQKAGFLSGGNQQKVVFAKLAATRPSVLLLHEPTQGIDVRAKVDIFNIVDDLSRQGVAVLIISTEVRELIGLCDRILVMYEGRITKEFDKDHMNPQDILLAIEGGKHSEATA